MNRITICKTIIQFIKNYITDPSKLEPHRAKNRFIRSRKLSMLHIIMYLFYSSKASMVSAKYCYVTRKLRLHQNDRCKRFTLF